MHVNTGKFKSGYTVNNFCYSFTPVFFLRTCQFNDRYSVPEDKNIYKMDVSAL